MDSDQGKLFIGGISWETTEEKLNEHFGKYGEVVQTIIMRDKLTGRPRGFGFIGFADPAVLDRVLEDQHVIDGRTVDAKRAMSKEEQQTASKSGNPISGRGPAAGAASGGSNVRTKKIFVGGLPPTLTEEGFRQYFETYGHVTDVVVMYDQTTQRPRGFGFISFDAEDAVDRVLHKSFHDVGGKLVEVKRALPKDANLSSGARSTGAGGAGGYQGYGGSGASTGAYDNRMDANRYMQPQAAGGGYSAYNSSGYGTPGYGYGAANGMGYGNYGVGGYGGPAGAYGNPNASTGGYISGPPGGPRSPWSNQTPSGYGPTAYGGSAGYGAAAGTWNSGAAAGVGSVGQAGQPPSGAAGYGSQGYGYGGSYGGSDGSYGGQGGYGAVGGRAGSAGGGGDQQGAGYGYGDANGNSAYQSAGWRADPSQGYGAQANGPPGGQGGYGGGYGSGYGGAQSRQVQ